MARQGRKKCTRCEREKMASKLGGKALKMALMAPATPSTQKKVKALLEAAQAAYKMADRALCKNPENCQCDRPMARTR